MISKVLFAGEGGVGKTSIIRKFLGDGLSRGITLGVDFHFIRKNNVNIMIWDFSGQERFKPLIENLFCGAKLLVLVFDLSRPKTLLKLMDWANYVRSKVDQIPVIVVGNKKDLGKKISDKLIQEVLGKLPFKVLGYIETSALTGENLNELFNKIATALNSDGHINFPSR